MSDYFDRVERQIVRRVEHGVPRSRRLPFTGGHIATAAAVLVVILVAGVFLLARGGHAGAPASPTSAAGATIAFSVSGAAPPAVIESVATVLRHRLHAAIPGTRVSVAGDRIVVAAAKASDRTRILTLAVPGVLTFYDWEADAVAPNGKTVASQLPSPDPNVTAICEGNGSSAPGRLGAGCMSLQQALALANRLGAGTKRRTEYVGGLSLRVPIDYTVLEASGPQPGHPTDGFFVLRNRPALTGAMITGPEQSRDPNTGVPDVTFGFTDTCAKVFQAVTAVVAHRGARVSSPGQTLNQHFAIAVDNQLITVPYIDFKQYPDGITGDTGAGISANFTKRSAQDLATLLRYGPLPVRLTATG